MRVNGLYGHVRRNDVRSVALFAGFVVAFHVLAVLALLVPLAMFDPDHAPLYGWAGYGVRWVPIVTVLGAVLFAAQMAWHVRFVRRRTEFRFVQPADEPRLWRVVEPLAIAAGLRRPQLAVIESPALNAFACGIRRKDAVLVFTRGLIEELENDELAAVAAHEIVHVVNGDIRLIAATNVCLDTLRLLQRPDGGRGKDRAGRIWEAVNLPVMAFLLPVMVLLLLLVTFLRHMAVHGSHLTRLLIASAREFVADAEAVRLTQNPAALVSALGRIEGRSSIGGLAAGQDAMMIDGAHQGPLATHPTIADRIAAIVAVTGSMALVPPPRRDPRPTATDAEGGSRRGPASPSDLASWRGLARPGAGATIARADGSGEFNRLGLTREMSFGAIAAVAVFLAANHAHLRNPIALAAALDPASMRPLFGMAGQAMSCSVLGAGSLVGLTRSPTDCGEGSMGEIFTSDRGGSDPLAKLAKGMARQAAPDRPEKPTLPEGKLAEVRGRHCFQTKGYSVGDRGLHPVDKPATEGETHSLARWLTHSDGVARRVAEAPPEGRDEALLAYFRHRKAHGETIHRTFGVVGLEVAKARYADPAHQVAIESLRRRLNQPGFASALGPVERAEVELLAAHPHDFISCTARRQQLAKT